MDSVLVDAVKAKDKALVLDKVARFLADADNHIAHARSRLRTAMKEIEYHNNLCECVDPRPSCRCGRGMVRRRLLEEAKHELEEGCIG